ncbi:MAG: lipM, partial [Lacunisphaera sp.]|nr:lipM [Lacunisphaera sp.]
FGFSQKIEFVRANIPSGISVDLCRRPTGGGIVDHRHDWTYALVVPRAHALYEAPATEGYRIVHEALAEALVALGQPARVRTETTSEVERADPSALSGQASGGQAAPPSGICFQRVERYDVFNTATGAKIAGAAMKRNKHGLLFQGSIERNNVGLLDWEEFSARFSAALGRALGAEQVETPWPDLREDEVTGLVEQYSAPEWNEYR